MSKSRKTFEVSDFIDTINNQLATNNIVDGFEFRQGLRSVLEDILFKTRNYRGFRYLSEDEVPEGSKPGINAKAYDMVGRPTYSDLFDDTDSSRVSYYK